MTVDRPRVLYVGKYPIGTKNATGQTLANIYGSSHSNVLQCCEGAFVSTGENVIALPPTATPLSSFSFGALRLMRASGGPAPAVVSDGMNSAVRRPTSFPGRVREGLRVLADLEKVHIGQRTMSEIRKFKPEVIHTVLGNVREMRVAYALSKRLNIPIAPHFMDDWPETLYSAGELLGKPRTIVERLLSELLDRSPVLLTIGRSMADEYERRYSKQCFVAGNSVNAHDFAADVATVHKTGCRVLVYVGGLHLGRNHVVADVARALEEHLPEWQLIIHAPADDVRNLLPATLPKSLKLGGDLSDREIPRALISADALLFVESAKPEISAYTRLSVSTKVPGYVAARKPVVAIGPSDQGSVRELRDHAVSALAIETIDSNGIRDIVNFLQTAHSSSSTTAPLPAHFIREAVQSTFYLALNNAISKPGFNLKEITS